MTRHYQQKSRELGLHDSIKNKRNCSPIHSHTEQSITPTLTVSVLIIVVVAAVNVTESHLKLNKDTPLQPQ